jgi:hypothetical protein
VPSARTTVTELGTGLGMLGQRTVDEALDSRTTVMSSLSPEIWDRLTALRASGAYDSEFHAAWANGQAFLQADDGLRGRLPRVVEWKGTGRAPGDEAAPIDLRVDHVYLISCKYLSNILFNVAPATVFDGLLAGPTARAIRGAQTVGNAAMPTGGDWYAEVVPLEYQALYDAVRAATRSECAPTTHRPASATDGTVAAPSGASGRAGVRGSGALSLPGLDIATDAPVERAGVLGNPSAALAGLPERAVDLAPSQRVALGRWLKAGWPEGAKERYGTLSAAVARASAQRWQRALATAGATGIEGMLWRLLRIGSAPYFVLGSSSVRSLRLRIATSWDWRQQFRLQSLEVEAQPGGQPRVGWEASVRDRVCNDVHTIVGHIEVRWSHGRFGGLPEAKGYLDTPHHRVPGYVTLR